MFVRQPARWTLLLFGLVSFPAATHAYEPLPAVPIRAKPATVRVVAIMGQVARPDVYELADPSATLFDVVQRAGGLTNNASRQIRILRSGRAGQCICFQPGLSVPLNTGDVLFAERANRAADKRSGSIEPAHYSPRPSTQPDPPTQSRVLIGLVNLFDTPVLLSLPPEHQTLGGLISLLGQPLDACAGVRVLSASPADEAVGSTERENLPLANGSVLDFGRAQIDHTKIPPTLPDGVFYKPVGSPAATETAATASAAADSSPAATPGDSRRVSNEGEEGDAFSGGPALTQPDRGMESQHVSSATAADHRPVPSIGKSALEEAAVSRGHSLSQKAVGPYAVKQRLPCLPSAETLPHGLIAPARPRPQTSIAERASPANKTAAVKRNKLTAMWNDWATTAVWTLGITAGLLSAALLISTARKTAAISIPGSAVDRDRQNPLEALIRDQFPLIEETVQLPLTHQYLGSPAGRRTVRVDDSQQKQTPHLKSPIQSTPLSPPPVIGSSSIHAPATNSSLIRLSARPTSSSRPTRSTRLKGAGTTMPTADKNSAAEKPAGDEQEDESRHRNAESSTAGSRRSGMLDRALESLQRAAER